ncbi:MAG: outer membrane beta-barrel protein [Thermodesulfobacteriota bacterium]
MLSRPLLCLLVLGGLLLTARVPDCHGRFTATPAVSFREEYNDNIFMDSTNLQDDVIITLSPGLTLVEQTERLEATLAGRLDLVDYAALDRLDAVDHDYSARTSYEVTPRCLVRAEAAYREDSRPDRDLETTGLILGTTSRERQTYTLGIDLAATELGTGSLTYTHNTVNFRETAASDYTSNSLMPAASIRLDKYLPRTTGETALAATFYDYPGIEIRNLSWTVGFSHELSERRRLAAAIGPRITETRIENIRLTEDNSGWVGRLIYSQWSEYAEVNLSLSQDITSGSDVIAGATEQTALSADGRYHFGEDLWAGLTAAFHRNQSSANALSTGDIDRYTYRLRPRVSWDLSDTLSMDLSYVWVLHDNRDAGQESHRNQVLLRLHWQKSLDD